MIKVHHAQRSRSVRVLWLLEELGVAYELHTLEFNPEVLKSQDHLALHPLGQVPVLEIDGARYIESGAQLQYVLEQYGDGRLEPRRGSPERMRYLQWFHYGEASLAGRAGDVVRHCLRRPKEQRVPLIVDETRERFRAALAVVDSLLSEQPYVAGDEFTAADIMVSYGVVLAKIIRELPAEFTHLPAYVERLEQRPAYQRALA